MGGALLALRQLSDDEQGSPPAAGAAQKKDGGGKGAQDSGRESGSGNDQDSSGSEGAQKEQLVRDYYAAAPGGTDEAWAMLGPEMQEQGRDRYDAFWRTIESVDVQSVEATSGNDSVRVTLVYHSNDGRTSTERKVEGLVASDDGGFLIDSDEPAA